MNQVQINELNFEGQNIYVGIDVHLKSWSVTILTDHLFHKTFSQPPQPEVLSNYLKDKFPNGNYFSAYEAGFCGFWIHTQLISLGVSNIIVNAADIPTSQKEKVRKTDAVDSHKIARALRGKALTPLYVMDSDTIAGRTLVRMRKTLVKDIVRFKVRLKSFLYFNGIHYSKDIGSSWTKGFIEWLNKMSDSIITPEGDALKILLSEFDAHRKSLREVNKKIRILSRTDKYKSNMKLMYTVPGIGIINAMTILTHIENIDRFKNSDHFASFVGLIPSCHSSGEKENNTAMTFRGQAELKSTFVECSWISVRYDPALTLSYNTYIKRMVPNKAIVRIARKVLNRIYYVLKSKREYVIGVVK